MFRRVNRFTWLTSSSTSTKGIVQLSSSYTGNSQSLAVTEKTLKDGLATKQAANTHLSDLADGTLSGSKIGSGINASNLTTGTVHNDRLPAIITDKTLIDSDNATIHSATVDTLTVKNIVYDTTGGQIAQTTNSSGDKPFRFLRVITETNNFDAELLDQVGDPISSEQYNCSVAGINTTGWHTSTSHKHVAVHEYGFWTYIESGNTNWKLKLYAHTQGGTPHLAVDIVCVSRTFSSFEVSMSNSNPYLGTTGVTSAKQYK